MGKKNYKIAETNQGGTTHALPAPLKIHLSEEEDQELLEWPNRDGIPTRVKERAEIIRLNYHGWSVEAISQYKQKSPHTVRASLHRWSNQGFRGLWEQTGRGRKRNWKEEDIRYIEVCLEEDERTYNAAQLSQKLTCIARGNFKQRSSKKNSQTKGMALEADKISSTTASWPKTKRSQTSWLRLALMGTQRRRNLPQISGRIWFLPLEPSQLHLCQKGKAKSTPTNNKKRQKTKYIRSLFHRSQFWLWLESAGVLRVILISSFWTGKQKKLPNIWQRQVKLRL